MAGLPPGRDKGNRWPALLQELREGGIRGQEPLLLQWDSGTSPETPLVGLLHLAAFGWRSALRISSKLQVFLHNILNKSLDVC